MNADTGALNRYRILMNELMFAREAEGGDLGMEVEAAYVARLDELWWQLSEEEQQAYEIELAKGEVPSIENHPNLVDRIVEKGDCVGPRKVEAAA